jgi:hypothetical protein
MYYLIFVIIIVSVVLSIIVNANQIVTSRVPVLNKFAAWILVICHDIITALLLGLLLVIGIEYVVYKKIDRSKLIILNILQVIVILAFLKYKMCVITIWYNQVLHLPKCTGYQMSLFTLFKGKQSGTKSTISYGNIDCLDNYIVWSKVSSVLVIITLLYNILYVIHGTNIYGSTRKQS